MRHTLRILRLRLKRHAGFIAAVALVATTVAAVCERQDWLGLSSSELGSYDEGLVAFTRSVERSRDVVIIAIDDRTFQEISRNESLRRAYGAWPYFRQIWAQIFDHLMNEGARAVVFDAVQDEPQSDVSGDLAMAQVIKERRVPYYVGFAVQKDGAGGQLLPRVDPNNRLPALAEPAVTPAPSIEPNAEEEFPSEELGSAAIAGYPQVTPEQTAAALAFPVTVTGLSLAALRMDDDEAGPPTMRYPVPPIAPLLESTSGFGLVMPEEDGDAKMRRTRFAYTDGVNNYVTLATAVAADLFGATAVELSPGKLRLGAREYRINPDGDAEINFGGKLEQRFQAVSLSAVLNDWIEKSKGGERRLPEDLFRGKVVIIAGFAAGTADFKATPFSGLSPGVAKVAAEIQCFIDGRFITDAPYWVSLAFAFLVAFFSVSLITVVKWPPLEILWPLVLYFGFYLLTGAFLEVTKLHLMSAMPALAGELASITAVAFNHFFASKERDRFREAFSKYLDPAVADLVAEQRELPRMDGESRVITAFFSDIRGFTTFTEKLSDRPDALLQLLNEYLTMVTTVLQRNMGCVDKYIGDAVVALFGAPVRVEDHAARACRAALQIQAAVKKLSAEFVLRGLPDVYTRIGINTSPMFVGNFGSRQVLDYTAMGDGMNLASRLEGVNKEYGTTILVGAETYRMAREQFELREVDTVRVSGKTQVTTIYELLAEKGQLTEGQLAAVELYGRALALYRQARFDESGELLRQALERWPEDGPARALLERCERLRLQKPLANGFDAVATLEK